jgi:hypothetical protein
MVASRHVGSLPADEICTGYIQYNRECPRRPEKLFGAAPFGDCVIALESAGRSSKFSRDEDDPAGLSHCAQLAMRRYATAPGGLSIVMRRSPRGVKINHAENHTKLSDSHLSERRSAPFAGSLVRRSRRGSAKRAMQSSLSGTGELALAAQSRCVRRLLRRRRHTPTGEAAEPARHQGAPPRARLALERQTLMHTDLVSR